MGWLRRLLIWFRSRYFSEGRFNELPVEAKEAYNELRHYADIEKSLYADMYFDYEDD